MVSTARRDAIIGALRRGTVPSAGLDALAVGIDAFAPAFDADLETASTGGAGFKAVRGDYGAGKTFFGRWLQERARTRGFATSEVQISEGETPLHHLETVYRRLAERLATPDQPEAAQLFPGVFRGVQKHCATCKLSAGAENTSTSGNAAPDSLAAFLRLPNSLHESVLGGGCVVP